MLRRHTQGFALPQTSAWERSHLMDARAVVESRGGVGRLRSEFLRCGHQLGASLFNPPIGCRHIVVRCTI